MQIADTLRIAVRRLARSPSFTIAVIATLALGVAAVSAVFSVVRAVLIAPLPYDEPQQLVVPTHTLQVAGVLDVDQSDATFLHYRNRSRAFESLAAFQAGAVNIGDFDGTRPSRVSSARVTSDLAHVLRVQPLLGRTFSRAEEARGATPVAVISEQMWATRFARADDVLQRAIRVDGQPHQIVGVLPKSVRFPDAETEIWLPLQLDSVNTKSAIFDLRSVGRLRAGTDAAAAARELSSLLPQVPELYAGRLSVAAIEQTHMKSVVRSLRDVTIGDVSRTLWIVFGAAVLLLVIACANVANLFLIRAESHARDTAVRRALGAGTARALVHHAGEAVIVAASAGVLGIAAATAAVALLRRMPGVSIPRLHEVQIDVPVVLVTAAVCGAAALITALFGTLRLARVPVSVLLTGVSRSATTGRKGRRTYNALVVAQIAFGLMLAVGSLLLLRSYAGLQNVDPGFRAGDLYTFRVALPAENYDYDAAARTWTTVLSEMRAGGGIDGVALTTKLPLDPTARRDTAVFVEGAPRAPNGMPSIHQIVYASPSYFRTASIPLLAGAAYEEPVAGKALLEVVVSRSIAKKYWGDPAAAIGRRLRLMPEGPWHTVAGVTGDVHGVSIQEPPDEIVYLPLVTPESAARGVGPGELRWAPRDVAVVVSSRRSADDVRRIATATIQRIAPELPIFRFRPLQEVVDASLGRQALAARVLAAAAALALLLAAVGLYAAVSYAVALRRRELAVRSALGALPRDLFRLVGRHVAVLMIVGLALGLVGAVSFGRMIQPLLYGLEAFDAYSLALSLLVLAFAAALAGYLPARRAAATDPSRDLRVD